MKSTRRRLGYRGHAPTTCMKLQNHVVFISGGYSALAISLARHLVARGNDVILGGRNEQALARACSEVGAVDHVVLDLADAGSIAEAARHLRQNYPNLNVLIHAAGALHPDGWSGRADDRHLDQDVAANFTGPVRLTKALLGLLEEQEEAALIVIGAGLAYVPLSAAAVYSASKSALHAWTRTLRHTLGATGVRVFEALPPALDTPLTRGLDLPHKWPVARAAEAILRGVERDVPEIAFGSSVALRLFDRLMPGMIFNKLNPPVAKNA